MFRILVTLSLFLFSLPSFATPKLIIEPNDGRQPILQSVQNAHNTLDLAIYGFTDPDLMNAFIQAKKDGKAVRILLQHYPYRATDENLMAIQRFSAAHLNFNFSPDTFYLLHQKTLMIDHRQALVMTFNFTRSTFEKERNFGLLIDDAAEVQEIQDVFAADWQHKSIAPSNPNLVWSPTNSRTKILGLIQSAKTEIKIYADGLSDYQVVGALAKAARQGVKVQVLTSNEGSGGKLGYLEKAGVQLHFDKDLRIHAKVLIVDQAKAMLGSINFTKPSMDRNRELAVITDDALVVRQLLKTYQSDWNLSS